MINDTKFNTIGFLTLEIYFFEFLFVTFLSVIAKEFLAIRRAISLNETFVYFVEIRTGDTRHIQQIHIDQPYMHPCSLVRIL